MKKSLLFAMMLLLLGINSGCASSSKLNSNNSSIKNIPITTNGLGATTSSTDEQSTTPERITPVTSPTASTNALGTDENLVSLQKKGLKVIEEQSFWVELENWGKVHFVTGETQIKGLPKLNFYLIDSKDNVLCSLPEFYGNMWILYEVKAISFKDINKDGLKDIIVVADYILGHGDKAAIPFPVGSVYFQKNKDFVSVPELDKEINEKKQNENIDMVVKFVQGKDIKLNK